MLPPQNKKKESLCRADLHTRNCICSWLEEPLPDATALRVIHRFDSDCEAGKLRVQKEFLGRRSGGSPWAALEFLSEPIYRAEIYDAQGICIAVHSESRAAELYHCFLFL